MKLPICGMVSELTSGQPFWPQRSLFTEAKLLFLQNALVYRVFVCGRYNGNIIKINAV